MKRLRKLSTHSRKSFQSSPFWEDLISTRFSFYTLTRVLLLLVLFLANLMKKVKNMLSPMHLEATTRLRTITLHTKGKVLLLYGSSYISGPIFMAPNWLCVSTTNLSSGWWPTTSLLVSLLVGHSYFKSMNSRLFIDMVLHIRTRTPCRRDRSLPLKISQKPGKISTKFEQYMYLMHIIILHYYKVTWYMYLMHLVILHYYNVTWYMYLMHLVILHYYNVTWYVYLMHLDILHYCNVT